MYCLNSFLFRSPGLCVRVRGECVTVNEYFFLPRIGLDLPKGIGLWNFAWRGEHIFWLGCCVKSWVLVHGLQSPSQTLSGGGLRSQHKRSMASGLVSASDHWAQWAFFFSHIEVLFFPSWRLSSGICRSPINKSLWNLYTPPNPSTSLKFFFFPQTVQLNSTYVLSEREKQPLAGTHYFYDNTKAQRTISHRISIANL